MINSAHSRCAIGPEILWRGCVLRIITVVSVPGDESLGRCAVQIASAFFYAGSAFAFATGGQPSASQLRIRSRIHLGRVPTLISGGILPAARKRSTCRVVTCISAARSVLVIKVGCVMAIGSFRRRVRSNANGADADAPRSTVYKRMASPFLAAKVRSMPTKKAADVRICGSKNFEMPVHKNGLNGLF